MAEELQGLLNKIQQDGINKAEAEKNNIIQAARQEADKIIQEAKESAAEILKQAKTTAASDEKRGCAAVAQAGRDIILKLRQEFQNRLNNVVKGCVGKSMSAELMASIIKQMAEQYQQQHNDKPASLELLVAAKDLHELETALRGGIAGDFQQNSRILSEKDISAGLKIGFNGGDLFFDFTDDAISDIICAYIGPRLAEMVKNN
jgi:V/A-type H+-transporting ATPase subunit E